jgi:putative phage-type endonuclease
MKIVTNMQQGSADWLQFRATRFGSSEAAAMLGLSSYTTRSELLRIKHIGLDREFSDWFQRNVLDNGHAVEAATRPIIEAQIDDTLYPVVCQGEGRLVASCDGMDLDGRLLWECKQWNEALAAEVAEGRVPDTHMPQCQHQLLVTGAERLRFTVSDGTGERLVSAEVLPSPEWFERLRNGWAQFAADLAAYTVPASAEPAPVGKAPDQLPALRIEVQGMVTASNLAEFKATAMAAIQSVNRNLKTDQDFADARKSIKWCEDIELRLKAAKEHALSQTADIDALFKAVDDISAEARRVRLGLDKVVTKRGVEVKEEAVTAARRALDDHIAGLNAELAPMRLQPVAADFAGAIKGLRSISSMQDALDTTLANGKIAADAQARLMRGNLAAFTAAAEGLGALFPDLRLLVHKAADDFAAVLNARIAKHQADEAEKARKAAEAEARRVAEAEERGRQRAAADLAEQQRQQAEAEAAAKRQADAALAAAAAPASKESTEGQQPQQVLKATPATADATDRGTAANVSPRGGAMGAGQPAAAGPAVAAEPATLTLGMICERLQFTVRADFLADVLHVSPAKVEGKRPGTYTESQFRLICRQLQSHVSAMGELYAGEMA